MKLTGVMTLFIACKEITQFRNILTTVWSEIWCFLELSDVPALLLSLTICLGFNTMYRLQICSNAIEWWLRRKINVNWWAEGKEYQREANQAAATVSLIFLFFPSFFFYFIWHSFSSDMDFLAAYGAVNQVCSWSSNAKHLLAHNQTFSSSFLQFY